MTAQTHVQVDEPETRSSSDGLLDPLFGVVTSFTTSNDVTGSSGNVIDYVDYLTTGAWNETQLYSSSVFLP